MLKKVKPVLPSRTARSKAASEGSFSITSCLRDALSAAGSVGAASDSGSSAIEPGSGLRNRSLKTKIVKKEFAAAAKPRVVALAGTELIALNRLRSRSMVTLPFSTIIF